jgi:hypothetical protein
VIQNFRCTFWSLERRDQRERTPPAPMRPVFAAPLTPQSKEEGTAEPACRSAAKPVADAPRRSTAAVVSPGSLSTMCRDARSCVVAGLQEACTFTNGTGGDEIVGGIAYSPADTGRFGRSSRLGSEEKKISLLSETG